MDVVIRPESAEPFHDVVQLVPKPVYTVNTMYASGEEPYRVELCIEIPYRGWCELQKSSCWAAFLAAVEDAQKERSQGE